MVRPCIRQWVISFKCYCVQSFFSRYPRPERIDSIYTHSIVLNVPEYLTRIEWSLHVHWIHLFKFHQIVSQWERTTSREKKNSIKPLSVVRVLPKCLPIWIAKYFDFGSTAMSYYWRSIKFNTFFVSFKCNGHWNLRAADPVSAISRCGGRGILTKWKLICIFRRQITVIDTWTAASNTLAN